MGNNRENTRLSKSENDLSPSHHKYKSPFTSTNDKAGANKSVRFNLRRIKKLISKNDTNGGNRNSQVNKKCIRCNPPPSSYSSQKLLQSPEVDEQDINLDILNGGNAEYCVKTQPRLNSTNTDRNEDAPDRNSTSRFNQTSKADSNRKGVMEHDARDVN